jgi:hypothetical protein
MLDYFLNVVNLLTGNLQRFLKVSSQGNAVLLKIPKPVGENQKWQGLLFLGFYL